jgi:DNA polymerase I-like protein with 3'-5' exonuclease and polymerase domains
MIYIVTNEPEKFTTMLDNTLALATVNDVLTYFKDKDELEFDTETMGFDPFTCQLLSAQFGDYTRQYVVDTLTVDITLFRTLLETKTILMQFAKFDLRFLYYYKIFPKNVYDTFLAEAVLYMGIKQHRKSLDVLVDRYCNIQMSKEVRNVIHIEGLSKRVIEYAAKDVKYLSIIKEKQLVLLKEKNLLRALDLDNKFVCVLAYVEFSGFKLSEDKWRIKIDKDNNTLADAITSLDKWIIDNEMTNYISHQLDMFNDKIKTVINWSSSKQVIKLFKELNIKTDIIDKHTGLIKNSVDAKVLAPQADKFEIIPIYTNYQKAAKLVSTYGEGVLKQINPQTGRIHTSFRQLMDTGRMSCGGDNAINLQNIPADEAHRGCFIPEKDNKIIVADYSGQESVVFANFSQDPEIIAFYQQGMGDMHSFIASKIYPELDGLSMSEIKSKHKQKRQNAKAAGFAIQYGGVGATIADNLNLTSEEGEAIYNGYFKAFPGIKNYFVKCKKQALRDGFVSLNQVSARKSFIDFYDRYKEFEKITKEDNFWDDYRAHKQQDTELFKKHYKPTVREYFKFKGMIERKSLNYPIQGSSAEITKFGALKFFNYITDSGLMGVVKICNIVHDEIVIECPEVIANKMAKILQECMEDAGKPFCKIIPLKAEPCITDHWEH